MAKQSAQADKLGQAPESQPGQLKPRRHAGLRDSAQVGQVSVLTPEKFPRIYGTLFPWGGKSPRKTNLKIYLVSLARLAGSQYWRGLQLARFVFFILGTLGQLGHFLEITRGRCRSRP